MSWWSSWVKTRVVRQEVSQSSINLRKTQFGGRLQNLALKSSGQRGYPSKLENNCKLLLDPECRGKYIDEITKSLLVMKSGFNATHAVESWLARE